MLRCLIVEDEPLARQLLTSYVAEHAQLALGGAFDDPIAALQFIRDQSVDLIFLDIRMRQLDGLQVARILGNTIPIILTTAYEEYAIAGYDLNVADYLLKPISFERFSRAVAKVVGEGASERSPSATVPPSASTQLFVKVGHQLQRIDYGEVRYLSGNGDYVTIYLTEGRKLLTQENLGALEARLPTERFCRIHRSHLVAIRYIDYVERNQVVLGSIRLPISRTYLAEFLQRINPTP